MNDDPHNLIGFTADIAAAYAANNPCRPEEIAALISATYNALAACDTAAAVPEPAPGPTFIPAVSPRSSIKHDHLISLIDGKPYKSLKRHLTGHGLSPEEYRQRYGLKPDYPMVAPGYSEIRRELAKRIGLGHHAGAGRGRPAPPKTRRGK